MTISNETIVFDVNDAKVYAMLTDAVGASPTYGAAVDIPGISQVSIDPNLQTAELKGDARVMAKRGRIDRMNIQATYGKISGDVLDTIASATTVASGSGSDEIVTTTIVGGEQLTYFKFAAQIQDVDTGLGDITIVCYKTQITGGTLIGVQTDQFGQPSFTAEAIAIDGSIGGTANVIAQLIIHETLTPLT